MPLHGVIPPIATPLDGREQVHEPSLRKLVRHLRQAGVHGLFVLGSTGEGVHLTDEEKRKVLDIVAEEVGAAMPLLVGAIEVGTKKAALWLKDAERRGATAAVVAPPFYYPISDDEVEHHFRSLAEETSLPLLLYHIPSATKVRMSLPLIERLADLPNIVGLKDSSGDLAFVFAVLDLMRDRPFIVFQGHDSALAPALLYGAHGGINALANLVPEWFIALYTAAQQGDLAGAVGWQRRINALLRTFPTAFLAALKLGLWARGWSETFTVSRPLSPLPEEECCVLIARWRQLGLKVEGRGA